MTCYLLYLIVVKCSEVNENSKGERDGQKKVFKDKYELKYWNCQRRREEGEGGANQRHSIGGEVGIFSQKEM